MRGAALVHTLLRGSFSNDLAGDSSEDAEEGDRSVCQTNDAGHSRHFVAPRANEDIDFLSVQVASTASTAHI
jgi:hypothetical protein